MNKPPDGLLTTRVIPINQLCIDQTLSNIIKSFAHNMSEIQILSNKILTIYIMQYINSDLVIDQNLILYSCTSLIRNMDKIRKIYYFDDNGNKLLSNNYENNTLINNSFKNIITTHIRKVPDSFINSHKNYCRPLSYFARSYLVNLLVYISKNFLKFQSCYIFNQLTLSVGLTKAEAKFSLFLIQNRINCNNEYVYSVNNRAARFNNIYQKYKSHIDNLINTERTQLRKIIYVPFTTIDNRIDKVNEKTAIQFIRYFSYLLSFLNRKNIRGFSLIPQLDFNMKYIKFDHLSLSTIYNFWKKDNQITSKEFKNDMNNKFNEMFKMKKFKLTLRKFKTINSISTNGCTVSLTFKNNYKPVKKAGNLHIKKKRILYLT